MAYVFDARKKEIKFTVQASEQNPSVNPCFVVKHWNSAKTASIAVNGKTSAKSIRQGIHRDIDGTQTLIIWMDRVMESSMTVNISR